MLARFLLCFMLSCALPALAQLPPPEVNVTRTSRGEHNEFDVVASGTVRAAPVAVWKILTDYERMPEFVPDMRSSRIISRTGNRVVVEQFGEARFLFLHRGIYLVVEVTERAPSVIDIGLITGDMEVYRCRWEIMPIADGGGTRIVYTGTLVPKFYVPGMFGANMIRSDIKRMMTAVLARLDAKS
ncbi:MAG: SRPBCC family protein [Telluria sp.]